MHKQLKDYFIPHEGNDFRPHSLQKAAVVGMTVMVLLTFALANVQSVVWISSQWLVSSILPAVIVELTNEERLDGSLSTLRRSSVLDQVATMKAKDMASKQYFAHNSPEGTTPWYWFGLGGYTFAHAGENLAIHFTDSGDVVEAWMDSPTHRANIMNGNYAEIGVGAAEGEYEGFKTVYVVQVFGTPAAVAEPSVAGETATVAPSPIIAQAEPGVLSAENSEIVLAESAAVTETMEYIEAEPELVAVEETPAPTDVSVAETEIIDMEVTDSGVALWSDFISTSTGATPATVAPSQSEVRQEPALSWMGKLITRPHLVLEMVYSLVALFVLVALLVSILIEIRRQEPVQVAYALMLLVLMYGLFEIHSLLSGGALIV